MAWLLGDGFDFYNATTDIVLPGTTWVSSTAALVATAATRFNAGQAAQVTNGSAITSVSFANSTTIYVNFAAMYVPVITGGGTTQISGFNLFDGASVQLGIWFRNGGDIVVTNTGTGSGTVLATSSVLFSSGVWHHYQFKIVINNATGSVELRMDGSSSPAWNPTGINTRNGTVNAQVNKLNFISTIGTTNLDFDDLYCFNDQGAAPNTWQGDVRAVQQMPASDSAIAWTRSTGSTNFSLVNELKQNSDTNYVLTNTPGSADAYNVGALASTPISIIAVQQKMIYRMDDSGPHTIKQQLISGATTANGSTVSSISTYQWQEDLYVTDPNTSAAWTATALNAVKIGPVDVS
jgi:hypothetical protein